MRRVGDVAPPPAVPVCQVLTMSLGYAGRLLVGLVNIRPAPLACGWAGLSASP